MRLLTSEDVPAFLAEKPAAALHFDADWDAKYREQVRRSMLDAEAALGEQASFAEIDCDANAELSKSIPVLNVPLVAYYRGGKLIAALIGSDQNVRGRIERVLRGETIGYKDGTTPHNPPIQRIGAAGMVSLMQQEALDYRNPSTRNEQRPVWPIVLASLGTCLFLVSVIWCGATWNVPGRFIFVPAGDAAMGFRSGSGWLSWIEYTDWDKREYSSWSLPWLAPLVLELLLVLLLLRRVRKRAA